MKSHNTNLRFRESGVRIKQKERALLKSSLQSDMTQLCPILANTIPCGVAYLHAGITKMERIDIENALKQKETEFSVYCGLI